MQKLHPGNSVKLLGGLSIDASAFIAKGKLKPGVEYELSRAFDGKTYFVTTKGEVGLEIGGGANSPIGAKVGVAGIAGQNLKVDFEPEATLSGGVDVGIVMKHKFVDDPNNDDDMVKLGLLAFKELPTPGDIVTDPWLNTLIVQNLHSIAPSIGANLTGKVSASWGGEAEVKPYLKLVPLGPVRTEEGTWNIISKLEVGLDANVGFGFSEKLGLGLAGKATFVLERSQDKIEKISMELEVAADPLPSLELEKFIPDTLNNKTVVRYVEDAAQTLKVQGKAIKSIKLETEIRDPGRLVQAGSSVIEDIFQLSKSNSLGEFSRDAAQTLGSVVKLLSQFRDSATVTLTAETKQVISVEAGGKIFVGGELKIGLETTEPSLLYSSR